MDEDVGHEEYHEEEYQLIADDGAKGNSLTSSCVIMMLGCVLFPASLGLLGWNERNAVCQNNVMFVVEDESVVADCGAASDVEGQFAFFSCPLDESSNEKMTPLTSFNTPGLQELISFNSVAGAQKIEMYQCIESKEEEEVPVRSIEEDSEVQTRRRRRTLLPETEESLDDNDGENLLQKDAQEHITVNAQGQATKQGSGRGKRHRHASLSIRSEEEPSSHDRRRASSGGETETAPVYRYKMAWSDVHYDSKEFKATPENIQGDGCPDFLYQGQVNHNPPLPDRGDGSPVELGRQLIRAPALVAGGFTFSDEAEVQKLTAEERVNLQPFNDSFQLNAETDNIINMIKANTLSIHPGQNDYLSTCQTERLGCVRISYNQSAVTHISVLGKVGSSGVMEPQSIEAAWGCSGTNLMKMFPKEMTKEEMIDQMRGERNLQTLVLRVGGLLCAWLSLYCCFSPIASGMESMGDYLSMIPYLGNALGNMLEGIVEMFICIMSCGFGFSIGLFVIAVIWLGMRPLIGGPLMVGVILLFIVGFLATKKAKTDPSKMRKGTAKQQAYGAHAPLMEQEHEDDGEEHDDY